MTTVKTYIGIGTCGRVFQECPLLLFFRWKILLIRAFVFPNERRMSAWWKALELEPFYCPK